MGLYLFFLGVARKTTSSAALVSGMIIGGGPALAQIQDSAMAQRTVRQPSQIAKPLGKGAQPPRSVAEANSRRPALPDVAGVTLGLTPEDVRAAALKAGYVLSGTSTGPTWEGIIEDIEARDFGKPHGPRKQAVSLDSFKGPGRQTLRVWYTQERGGPRSSSVSYTVPSKDVTWETMKASARAKYGTPSYRTMSKEAFCSPGEKECNVYGQYRLPRVELLMNIGSSTLKLQQGLDYEDEVRRSVRDEVNRRHPKNNAPSF